MRYSTIGTPTKGMITDPPLGVQDVASTLEGFWHHTGRLRSMEGRLYLSSVPHITSQATDGVFGSHVVYQDSLLGTRYVVARNGNYIWLGLVCSSSVVSHDDSAHTLTVTTGEGAKFPQVGSVLLKGAYSVNYTYRNPNLFADTLTGVDAMPIDLAVGDTVDCIDWRLLWGNTSTTGGYDARTAGTDESFVQVNDILYFTGGGVPGRWDGTFEEHRGVVASHTAAPTRIDATTGPGFSVTTHPPVVGDTIYFKLWDATNSRFAWSPNGFIITAVFSTYLLLNGNHPTFTNLGVNGGSAVEYQIVRTCQMGVPASIPLASVGLIADGAIDIGTYRYYSRYVSSITGYKGAMSRGPNEAEALTTTMTGDTATPVAAILVTGSPGTTQITWTAKTAGAGGNSIGISIDGLSYYNIKVGSYITYASGARTAAAIKTAVEAHAQMNALVGLTLSANTTPVPAFATTYLSGGGETHAGGTYFQSVNVDGSWPTTRPEPHVDGVEIWRTRLGGLPTATTGTAGTDKITWTAVSASANPGDISVQVEISGGRPFVTATPDNGVTWHMLDCGVGYVNADDVVAAVLADAGLSAFLFPSTDDSLLMAAFPATELVSGSEGAYTLRATIPYSATAIDTNYVDVGTANSADYTLEPDYLYYARPGVIDTGSILRYHEDRLITTPTTHPGLLRFSTMTNHEYWPISGVGNYGGTWQVSPDSDAIVDMITEGGAYELTGRVGNNLFIQTRTKSFRFYGTTWEAGSDQFKVDEAFPIGSAAETARNMFGNVLWLSPDGPMKMSVGSLQPVPIYTKLWPRGLRAEMKAAIASQPVLLSAWCSAQHEEHYILAGSDGYGDKLWIYHVPSDSWTTLPLTTPIKSMVRWDGPYDVGQLTCLEASACYRLFGGTGPESVDPRARANVWNPKISTGAGPTYLPVKWITGPILPEPSGGFLRMAHITQISALVRKPYSTQTLVLSIYADGNLTTPQWTGVGTVTPDTSLTGEQTLVTWYANGAARGRQFNFGLVGTMGYPLECSGIEFSYDLQEVSK